MQVRQVHYKAVAQTIALNQFEAFTAAALTAMGIPFMRTAVADKALINVLAVESIQCLKPRWARALKLIECARDARV